MEYRKVYFRIRSRYQFDSGWPAETDAAKFHEESRSLFQSAGWDLQPGGDSTSDTVTMLDIKKRFGKNAILKGLNLEDGATARERNNQIGGHKA